MPQEEAAKVGTGRSPADSTNALLRELGLLRPTTDDVERTIAELVAEPADKSARAKAKSLLRLQGASGVSDGAGDGARPAGELVKELRAIPSPGAQVRVRE